MRQWFGVSATAALNMRWTQFINPANYEIIYLDVLEWANVKKVHIPPSTKRYFSPGMYSLPQRPRPFKCWKKGTRPGMAGYRKSLLISHSVMKLSCSCFVNSKYKYLRCELPTCNNCSVIEIKFALWNAQSLQKKSGLVCDIFLSNRLDIFAITETWLNSEGNNISLAEILNTLKDFTVIQVPREYAKGGGVALFLRKAFTTIRNSGSNFTSFKHLDVSISHGKCVLSWFIVQHHWKRTS